MSSIPTLPQSFAELTGSGGKTNVQALRALQAMAHIADFCEKIANTPGADTLQHIQTLLMDKNLQKAIKKEPVFAFKSFRQHLIKALSPTELPRLMQILLGSEFMQANTGIESRKTAAQFFYDCIILTSPKVQRPQLFLSLLGDDSAQGIDSPLLAALLLRGIAREGIERKEPIAPGKEIVQFVQDLLAKEAAQNAIIKGTSWIGFSFWKIVENAEADFRPQLIHTVLADKRLRQLAMIGFNGQSSSLFCAMDKDQYQKVMEKGLLTQDYYVSAPVPERRDLVDMFFNNTSLGLNSQKTDGGVAIRTGGFYYGMSSEGFCSMQELKTALSSLGKLTDKEPGSLHYQYKGLIKHGEKLSGIWADAAQREKLPTSADVAATPDGYKKAQTAAQRMFKAA